MTRVHRKDYAWEPLSLPTKTSAGMRVEGYLTSSGVFAYPQPDGTTLREWRPPAEVEDATSVDSLKFVPVTIDHPEDDVTIDNVKELGVGVVGDRIGVESIYAENISQMDYDKRPPPNVKLRASMILTDAKALSIIEDKTFREVSCGYYCDLEMTAGITPDGEVYDAIQRGVRYNHLAMGVVGRHGPGVAIRVDSKKTNPPAPAQAKETTMSVRKITLDSIPFEAPEQLAAAIESMTKKHGDALAAEAAKSVALTVELDAVKVKLGTESARADAADAGMKAAQKEAAALASKIKEGVKARKDLERTVEGVMGAEAFASGNLADSDDDDLRVAAIKHVNPDLDLSEKVTAAKAGDIGAIAYVGATFDYAVKSGTAARADSLKSDGGTLRVQSAHADGKTPSADFDALQQAGRDATKNAYKRKA